MVHLTFIYSVSPRVRTSMATLRHSPAEPLRPGQRLRLWVQVLEGVQVVPGEEATLPLGREADSPLLRLRSGAALPRWLPSRIDREAAVGFSEAMGAGLDAPLIEAVRSGRLHDADSDSGSGGGEEEEEEEDDRAQRRERNSRRRRRRRRRRERAREQRRQEGDAGAESERAARRNAREDDGEEGVERQPPAAASSSSEDSSGEAADADGADPAGDAARERLHAHLLWLARQRKQEQRGLPLPMAVAQCAVYSSYDDSGADRPEVGVLLLPPAASAGGAGGRGAEENLVRCRGGQRVRIDTLIASTMPYGWHMGLGSVLGDVHHGFPWRRGVPPPSRPTRPGPELYERLALPPWTLRQHDTYLLLSRARVLLYKLLQIGSGEAVPPQGRGGEAEPAAAASAASPAPSGDDDAVVCTDLEMPDDPVEACLFLGRVLPLTFLQRRQLVAMDAVTLRLRHLLRAMQQMERHATLNCRQCDSELADLRSVFVARGTRSALGTYVNPNDYVHSIVTLREVRNFDALSQPTFDHTWFPHYAWVIVVCSACFEHIGWVYLLDPALQPKEGQLQQFFGLRRDAVRYVQPSRPEDDDRFGRGRGAAPW